MEYIKVFFIVICSILVIFTGNAASKTQECVSGLKKCFTSFTRDMGQHLTGTQICRDVGVFVHCMLGMDCDLPPEKKTQSFDLVESLLAKKGLKCDEISKLKASHVKESELIPKKTQEPDPESAPKYSPNFYPETPDFFKTTTKSFQTSADFRAPPGKPGSTARDHDNIQEPTSSRRSRRLRRPVSWSNWSPQSQSSDSIKPGQSFFVVSYRFSVFLLAVSVICNYLFNVL